MRAARLAQARPASSRVARRVASRRPARTSFARRFPSRASAAPPTSSVVAFATPPETDAMAATIQEETTTVPSKKRRAKERFVVHTLAGYDVEGVSVGGQETCIVLPQLKIVFDSGRCPQRCVYADTMCLSHTHMDHVGGAGFYIATRSLIRLPPPVIVLPASRARAFEAFVDALRALDGSELPHEVVRMAPLREPAAAAAFPAAAVHRTSRVEGDASCVSDRPSISNDRAHRDAIRTEHRISKRLAIRAFATSHPVPSQGYVVYVSKEKLRPEFAGRSSHELTEMNAAGVRITETVEVPEVAFTGDTTVDWIDAATGSVAGRFASGETLGEKEIDVVAADALRARLLICECTFIDDRCSVSEARRFGHTHLDELIARQEVFQNEAILLIHFSARYKAEEIAEAMRTKLPERLKNIVTPMLVGFG